MNAQDVLRKYQKQCDPDGIDVQVSRQALDETLDEIERLTADRDHWRGRALAWAERAGTAGAKRLQLQARVEALEVALFKYAGISLAPTEQGEKMYPCEKCGLLRTKAEGGTTFTVCDDCWPAATEQELWCSSCKVSHSPDCEVHHHLMADGRCTCNAATEQEKE